jgi:ribA/ribD-fused uncharacterized protein
MMDMKINCFDKEYAFLSNFYPVEIEMSGVKYPTSEHAFQAMKTMDQSERMSIANCSTAGRAKRLGKKVTLRNDWEDIKLKVMYVILQKKFSENEDLKQKLLDTGDIELVEGNNWHDYYWGVCNGKGQNNLGKILMLIRKELKEEL